MFYLKIVRSQCLTIHSRIYQGRYFSFFSGELKQSRSSELDLNGNSIHSSQESLPNDDYESSSGESSEELSTMIDGAATVLAGKLNSWAKLTSDIILKISLDDFDSIEDLEEKIIEITVIPFHFYISIMVLNFVRYFCLDIINLFFWHIFTFTIA